MSHITTSQTIGPFSHAAWQWAVDASAAGQLETSAATITISGIIYDGDGTPINDAQIEAWQPEAAGAEAAQALPGFRRVPSGEQGEFSLRLSQCAPPANGTPATFITVFARGLVKHQFTAVFLEDDAGLATSAILQQVPAARRPTLIARKTAPGVYYWDIWMQSDKETVFFDYA
ncbi:protocatechuate 3,4-dioxygenase [Duganella violaceipulchra]|uniref:Protocatechuate 3,4-dioxygenase n=1 Tax=Duganella violaceipulchra TaxID=2849652 RepID=A0AA41H4E3_9BURK|nr:protocatechuate 3,4-dioxygenase [Duganella violaceicalia]MBV6319425.1 protocatechuate 3,4-dioxygenase [Duganella violaceicalia]MCP2006764.1 protocatechuate 3,4-dioxygenase alpha subunit [Duganella violaceicalia]